MNKTELKIELLKGATMDSLFTFTKGDECLIFHADRFSMTDDIIYIPDTGLNKIPLKKPIRVYDIDEVVSNCYTGNDFLEEAGGDETLAERLFWLCNWQHPITAHDDFIDDEEDDDKLTPVFAVMSSISLSEYTEPHCYSSAPDHEEIVALYFSEERAKSEAERLNNVDRILVEETGCDMTNFFVRQYQIN